MYACLHIFKGSRFHSLHKHHIKHRRAALHAFFTLFELHLEFFQQSSNWITEASTPKNWEQHFPHLPSSLTIQQKMAHWLLCLLAHATPICQTGSLSLLNCPTWEKRLMLLSTQKEATLWGFIPNLPPRKLQTTPTTRKNSIEGADGVFSPFLPPF